MPSLPATLSITPTKTELQTELYRSDVALKLITESAFQHQAQQLAEQMNGFVRLQTISFLAVWYKEYRQRYEPVLIVSYLSDGSLAGILGLAWHSDSQTLLHAGNAEYHGWLAAVGSETAFLKTALQLIQQHFEIKIWKWNWLPTGLNIQHLKDAVESPLTISIEKQEVPTWNLLDTEKLQKLLKSRSNKSKFNRYKKRGNLFYEHITDPVQLHKVLEIVQYQCDIRREAVNNARPFAEDPFKIDFVCNLVAIPDHIHTSALWLDDQLLAFHMGITDGQQVSLGLTSYDPTESKQSPGALLIIELGRHLSENGYTTLDMTPGNNSYKDRFANHYLSAYRPTIYFSRSTKIKGDIKETLAQQVKQLLTRTGMDISTLRDYKTNFKIFPQLIQKHSLGFLLKQFGKWLYTEDKWLLYSFPAEQVAELSDTADPLTYQQYEHLLYYQDVKPFLTRRALLQNALSRFSSGAVIYSALNKEQILTWLGYSIAVKDIISFGRSNPSLEIEQAGQFIHNLYQHSNYSNPTTFARHLHHILTKEKSSGKTYFYVILHADTPLPSEILVAPDKLNTQRLTSQRKWGTIKWDFSE